LHVLNYVVDFLYANLMIIIVVLARMKGVCFGDDYLMNDW